MTRHILWLELEGVVAVNIHSTARANDSWQSVAPDTTVPVSPDARERADLRMGSLSPDEEVGRDDASLAKLREWAAGASLAQSRVAVSWPSPPVWHRRPEP